MSLAKVWKLKERYSAECALDPLTLPPGPVIVDPSDDFRCADIHREALVGGLLSPSF